MYNYQTGCLRRLHALGQRHSMDITVEGFSSWMFKGLTFLLPFLIVGYLIQAYCAYVLFDMYFRLDCSRDWQVLVLAFLFSFIAIGNGITIALVIAKKVALKNKTDSVSRMASKYRPKTL
uniref:Transmembrane protein n=1 Tax=Globodera rostochiensis TaxID=31243 RepID=A0A914HBK8_GLORO